MKDALEELQIEFMCGKAMELSHGINNIVQILNRHSVNNNEFEEWAKAAYYICDLYYFEKDKKIYKEFLENKKHIKLID